MIPLKYYISNYVLLTIPTKDFKKQKKKIMLHLECKAPLVFRSSGCAAQHEQDGVYDSVSCTS